MQDRNNGEMMLLVLSLALAAGAVLTVIPYGGAAEKSILGYKSLCSFNPVSTFILGFLAKTLHTLRKRRLEAAGS